MSRANESRFHFLISLARATGFRELGQACFCMAMLLCLQAGTSESVAGIAPALPRERLSFNAGCRFQKDDPPGTDGQLAYQKIKNWVTATGNECDHSPEAVKGIRPDGNLGGDISYAQRTFDDNGWRTLNLPHDWGIEGPFKQEYPGETGKLPWWGVAWYRKHFTATPGERGKQFYLDIDGAMAYSTVWMNGKFVGGWPYGYASFELDLTPYLDFGGDNVIAIRLDNPPDSSRWYPGGGIYRNVWLVKTGPVHVAHWGTYVTTPEVSPARATVDVKVTVENHSTTDAHVAARTEVFELGTGGQRSARPVASSAPKDLKISTGAAASASSTMHVGAPKLWSIARPNLYLAVVTIELGGKPVDRYETVFGIRTIKFDPDKGFLLNGEHVRLNGVCDHHDLGPLGA